MVSTGSEPGLQIQGDMMIGTVGPLESNTT